VDVGIGDPCALEVPLRRPLVQIDDARRIRERQRLEQQPVDETEDGGVGGDRHGENRDDREGKERLMTQRPECET
tara:strand:- start:782 stop:1006 length:225 start_codon:yes stop_codon:yes gene_type:complete